MNIGCNFCSEMVQIYFMTMVSTSGAAWTIWLRMPFLVCLDDAIVISYCRYDFFCKIYGITKNMSSKVQFKAYYFTFLIVQQDINAGLTKVVLSFKALNCEESLSWHPAAVLRKFFTSSYSRYAELYTGLFLWEKRRPGQQYNFFVELLPHNELNLSHRLGLSFLKKVVLLYELQAWGIGLRASSTCYISLLFIREWVATCCL